MKTFMTTTAIALAMGTSAVADGHTGMFSEAPYNSATELLASDLLGARVYASEADIDNTLVVNDADETEWDDIGEINEIVLTRDGTTQSVIVGVGGFLGIGEKDVSVNMSDLQFISDGDDADDYFVVIKASKAGVEDATSYERGNIEDHSDMKDDAVMGPMVDREGYATAEVADLTTENLTGARVYGADDEDVGEVSKLLLTDDGKLDRAVIDVGGFLGMGERPVAVAMNELTIIRADGGDDIRVYIDSSQEALEAQPAYEE